MMLGLSIDHQCPNIQLLIAPLFYLKGILIAKPVRNT